MTNDPNTFYAIANRENKLLTPYDNNPYWVDESSGEEILYVEKKNTQRKSLRNIILMMQE